MGNGRFTSKTAKIFGFKKGNKLGRANWKGGGKSSHGYWRIGKDGGRVYQHRDVMEAFLGRRLRLDEVVHHKNGDKSDNRLENLEILTKGEHAQAHYKLRKRDVKGRLLPVSRKESGDVL